MKLKKSKYKVSRLKLLDLADGKLCGVFTGGSSICLLVGGISGWVSGWARSDFIFWSLLFGILGLGSWWADRKFNRLILEIIEKENQDG